MKRKLKLMTQCLNNNIISIRELAKIIGNIVATFPAVTYGPLHYRHLERDKILGLRHHRENFDRKITLSATAVYDIQWWINDIDNSCHHILKPKPYFSIYTDASPTGWHHHLEDFGINQK